jgi:hypothetical protein
MVEVEAEGEEEEFGSKSQKVDLVLGWRMGWRGCCHVMHQDDNTGSECGVGPTGAIQSRISTTPRHTFPMPAASVVDANLISGEP